ncbi:transport inhibitor response 1-like protein [Nicotiana tabacum]|uniref:Transport inhibitor response 1-like protein n=2 Tax=Nicotiana TaxID=4085 RepID=A0A1S4DS09_TOBAC|nr:PREDICTED: transport inhibitor response 1-like protein [Nicotiana sylvestris]XP_016516192.1 PREDICTED: transport inhibitor response 1-like protein [Nicotiana tabacum]
MSSSEEMSEDEERPPCPSDLSGGAAKSRNCCAVTDGSVAGGGGGGIFHFSPHPDQVLENVLENVLCFLTDRRDRNAASLVSKSWYRAEALTRSEVYIGNCYAVSPGRVTARFKRVTSVAIKGKPRFADFSLLPPDWGAHFAPWASVLGEAYRGLEKLYLKRMSITDDDLSLLARCFPHFKELVLVCCDGFGTSGLAIIARDCRQIRVLDLIESEVSDDEVDWISFFPENKTCLESLTFDCVECPIDFEALERLVIRSPSLKRLRLNRFVSITQLYRLMIRAPQLTNLGTGSFGPSLLIDEQDPDYASAFSACKSIVCLSGFREIAPEYLPAIYPVCCNLTSLNFSYAANINTEQFKSVISRCHKLQVLWVFDSVCDEGLQAVAATCKDLREIRVFPIEAREDADAPVSEVGLLAISEGCRKLQSILYFCQRMTNAAVIAMSKNCPDLVVFRLCIMGRHLPDHVTGEPMDEGFGAIVKNCKKLTRLAVSGLLTDKAFSYIGQYGKLVRTLSVAFAGNSDLALKYVLEGCPKLQKLEIRDCPFGDLALRSGLHHYHNMRFLWLSSCRATLQGCQEIARQMPRLVVEVIGWEDEEESENGEYVNTLYMYRSLDGPRADAPPFVQIL